jgi:fumarate hydratase class II
MSEKETRVERDSMGEFEVPARALYGASTARAKDNFPISDLRFKRSFIRAIGEIKRAASLINNKKGLLEEKKSKAIAEVAVKVRDGSFDEDFILDIFQTGSGTSTNMNANEIISNKVNEDYNLDIHPNNHVNMSQSSNDVIPTATNIAVVLDTTEKLIPEINSLINALRKKGKDFNNAYKNGRTHLMDATPVTLGQELDGYAELLNERVGDIDSSLANVNKLAIGGTAVGTGINAPSGFGTEVVKEINKTFGTSFIEVENHFTRQGSRDEIVNFSSTLKTLSVSLFKISNDIRWMGSGPVSGLSELKFPALQPGSSIMPGKVNPVIPEMILQVAAQVIGNDATVTFAGSQGNFELNTMLPVMAHNVLESIEILTTGINTFNKKCVEMLEIDSDKLLENVQKNPMLVTALVPELGYDFAAEIAKEAMESGKTIKEIVLSKELMSEEEIDRILDISKLV